MQSPFKILVADRNPHVRDFLKRELTAAGHSVSTAKDGKEVLSMFGDDDTPDLLVLELDMPLVSGLEILAWFKEKKISTPVIVHTCHTEDAGHPALRGAAAFFEKRGDNIDGFKEVVSHVLATAYPRRFEAKETVGRSG